MNLDDAGSGRRGLRAESSGELLEALADNYGVVPVSTARDLGGSSNLNLLVDDGQRRFVLRVYRPWVTAARLGDIQCARRSLASAGFPCLAPIPTRHGAGWSSFGPRLMELETYVETDGRMNTIDRVEAAVRRLGDMHNVLRSLQISAASDAPPFVNHIPPGRVIEGTRRGAHRIRSWKDREDWYVLANAAEDLAQQVMRGYTELDTWTMKRHLVHGDFWDNNVLYRGSEIALIHDFDHMGVRHRIDDLALTLCFLNAEHPTDDDSAVLRARQMVDAYDRGLDDHLTATERAAIPIALAGQPLWSIGGWVAELDDEEAARGHAAGMLPDVQCGLRIMRTLPRWQAALALRSGRSG
jgi:homoserine kinase type II